jgi:hypothetical protein
MSESELRRLSVEGLLDAARILDYPSFRENQDLETRLDYGRSILGQLNAVMKLAMDAGDHPTFTRVESAWQDIPRPIAGSQIEDPVSTDLVRRRRALTFGLAMWAVHLCREPDKAEGEPPVAELRILNSRFGGVEDVFDGYDSAANAEESERAPWANWFLRERAPGRFDYIPTSPELLFTALLLALAHIGGEQELELRPREWFGWRAAEIEEQLDALRGEGERWMAILGVLAPQRTEGDSLPAPDAVNDDWTARVERLERGIARGRDLWSSSEREAEREAPLAPDRVEELEASLLEELRTRRYVRHLFAVQAALEHRLGPPEDFEARIARSWIPRGFLTADSRVVGIDMAGRDLARTTLSEEGDQLVEVLPKADPQEPLSEADFEHQLKDQIENMREVGFVPTVLLIPMSWRLREALGFSPFGTPQEVRAHPLVPTLGEGEFAGIFDEVPVLELVQLEGDALWIADLPALARFLEWESDRDAGVKLELREFDDESARRFLEEHPEAAGDRGREEAVQWLRDHLLFTQRSCWTLQSLNPEAARRLQLPAGFTT